MDGKGAVCAEVTALADGYPVRDGQILYARTSEKGTTMQLYKASPVAQWVAYHSRNSLLLTDPGLAVISIYAA